MNTATRTKRNGKRPPPISFRRREQYIKILLAIIAETLHSITFHYIEPHFRPENADSVGGITLGLLGHYIHRH